MGDLKRYRHGARNGVMTPDPDGPFVRYEEAAAALEAAREDAEKWRQAFVIDRARLYCKQGMKVEQSLIHAETDATVAAIDQARGKGGGEVGNG